MYLVQTTVYKARKSRCSAPPLINNTLPKKIVDKAAPRLEQLTPKKEVIKEKTTGTAGLELLAGSIALLACSIMVATVVETCAPCSNICLNACPIYYDYSTVTNTGMQELPSLPSLLAISS